MMRKKQVAWLAVAVALTGTACSATGPPSAGDHTCLTATATIAGVTANTPVGQWLTKTPFYVAHRGGDASWVEGTADAYGNAAKWNPDLALEVPVWLSADGVWVVSEDPTTGRVFNADHTIASTTWATLSTLRTKVGNLPMARLVDDVLKPYGSTRILFIDNKSDLHVKDFFDLLDSYAGAKRYISKGYFQSKHTALEAHRRGYLTWGYYESADMEHFVDTQSAFDLVGLDYSATVSDFDAIQQADKPLIAYMIRDHATEAQAACDGASGFMVSAVREVVPQVPPPQG